MAYKTIGTLTLKKNYINSIGTDGILAYDNEEQLNPTSTGKTTNRYYYHTNQLGSVTALTNSTGAIMQTYSYDAFGKAYVRNGSGTGTTLISFDTYTGSTYSNSRLYTGREYDKEIGMYYLRARYYNTNTGKFISRDPIGQNDQVNLYTYVANSPLKYVDRMGREKALAIVIEKFNFFGAYFENLRSFNTPTYFSKITLNPAFGNLKLSPEIRARGKYIDDKYQTDTSGKKINIDSKDIWLADLGNIMFAYNGQKVGYSLDFLKFGAFLPTAVAGDAGYKKEGIINNELEDWKFYEAGYKLAETTKTGKISRDDLLGAYFGMFPNGR